MHIIKQLFCIADFADGEFFGVGSKCAPPYFYLSHLRQQNFPEVFGEKNSSIYVGPKRPLPFSIAARTNKISQN